MCARVGQDFVRLEAQGFFDKSKWYWRFTWTQAEQDKFRDWLADFLYIHKYADKRKYRGNPRNVHQANKIVANYGWKIKNETTTKLP